MTTIILAAEGFAGETALVASAAAAGITVARRSLDAADLLAAAATDLTMPIVLTGNVPRLSPEIITRLLVGNRTVIGLSADDAAAHLLRTLGVSRIVQLQAAADATMRAVSTEILHGVTGVWDTGTWQRQYLDASQEAAPLGGQLVAVWGPSGAPGRTSIAIAVADEFAHAGFGTCLVDADTYAPSICFALGIIEDASGIVIACRNADNGTLNNRSLQLSTSVLRGHLNVLGGLPRADRWPDIRHSALTSVWETARSAFARTVIDVGPCIEDEGGVLQHGGGTLLSTRRNAAAITALAAADVVVAVTRDDPLAISRLVTQLPAVAQLGVRAPIVIAMVQSGERRKSGAALDALRSSGVNLQVVPIAIDGGGYRNALAQGALLAEAAPRSPALKGIRSLYKVIATEMAAR
ncbi:MAG: hypothetical protein EXQ60_01575 [Candidatus Nanopelagicales bacterium]|nr:hypothetical protein [Candidatus Nanopelagicales bacterium]